MSIKKIIISFSDLMDTLEKTLKLQEDLNLINYFS